MTQDILDAIELETGPNPAHAVIWLHGLGADGNDFAPIVPELQLQDTPPIRFIFPHAPVMPVTINGGMSMRAWYDISNADLLRREDAQGVRQSEIAVRAFIDREGQRGVQSSNIVLAGFSQGSAMTLHTGLRLDRSLAGLVALSGYLPLPDTLEQERREANQDTPIFMAHGVQDPVVPFERAQASCRQLQELGYQVDFQSYPMPHSVCLDEIIAIGAFLRRVLK